MPLQDPWSDREVTVRSVKRGTLSTPFTVLSPLLLGLALLGVWAGVTTYSAIEPWRLPSPFLVLERSLSLFSSSALWGRVLITLIEAFLGCLLGALVAIPLAVAIDRIPVVRAAVEPFLGASQALPAIAIAPLLVLWLGYGVFPIAALCALIVFFPIVVSTVLGLGTIDREVVEAASLDGAAGANMLVHIRIPLALPAILSGIRNGFSLSFTGAIVGEMVMGGEGLGQILMASRQSLDTATMFVVIALLGVLSTSIYQVLRAYEVRVITERF